MVGTFTAIPAISSDGTLYVNVDRDVSGMDSDPENGLYALDLDGNEKWFVPRSSYEIGHIAIGDDGTVYTNAEVEADGSTATMLTIAPSGELLQQFWPPEVHTFWGTNVAIAADGTVYAAARVRDDADDHSYRGKLFALHPDGTLKWSREFEQCPTGGLAIDATGAVYLSTYDRGGMDPSGIMGFEPDGAVRMSLNLGERLTDGDGVSGPRFFATSVVLADDGLLYVGSLNGKLHIIRDPSSSD